MVMKFMEEEWDRFKKLLKKEKVKYNLIRADEDNAREASLNITLHFLRMIGRKDLADTLENSKKFPASLSSITHSYYLISRHVL